MSEVCKPSQLEPPTKSTVRQPSYNRTLNKLKDSQDDWDFKLPMCIWWLTWVPSMTPLLKCQTNLCWEGKLDVITEPTLDAVPSQTKYALALQPTSLHIRGSVVTIKERRPNISRETMTSKCPEEDYNARCISSRWYSEIKLDILFQQEQDRASLLKLLPSGQ